MYGFWDAGVCLHRSHDRCNAAVVHGGRDDPSPRTDPNEWSGIDILGWLHKRRAIMALVCFRFAFNSGKLAVVFYLPIYALAEVRLSTLSWVFPSIAESRAHESGTVRL